MRVTITTWSHRIILSSVGVAVICTAAGLAVHRHTVRKLRGPFRIGFFKSGIEHFFGSDGKPHGAAIDLLNDALDLQLQISRDTVKSQDNAVRLTRLRGERGVATKVDMLQAQEVRDAASAQIKDLERQITRNEDAIGILLGDYPEGVPRGRALTEQYLPPDVPEGITSALLERRPHIRQAEKNLIAVNAQIGVARAAFFPPC